MSIEELKQRAHKQNVAREEQSARDLEQREQMLHEKSESKPAPLPEKKVELHVEWNVTLRMIVYLMLSCS